MESGGGVYGLVLYLKVHKGHKGRSFFYHGIKGLPVKARDSGGADVWEFSYTHYNKISI